MGIGMAHEQRQRILDALKRTFLYGGTDLYSKSKIISMISLKYGRTSRKVEEYLKILEGDDLIEIDNDDILVKRAKVDVQIEKEIDEVLDIGKS